MSSKLVENPADINRPLPSRNSASIPGITGVQAVVSADVSYY